jgi:hypothetical protein
VLTSQIVTILQKDYLVLLNCCMCPVKWNPSSSERFLPLFKYIWPNWEISGFAIPSRSTSIHLKWKVTWNVYINRRDKVPSLHRVWSEYKISESTSLPLSTLLLLEEWVLKSIQGFENSYFKILWKKGVSVILNLKSNLLWKS